MCTAHVPMVCTIDLVIDVGCVDEADDRGGCSCRALGAAATQGHQLGEAEHGGLGPGGWEGKPSPPVVRRATGRCVVCPKA